MAVSWRLDGSLIESELFGHEKARLLRDTLEKRAFELDDGALSSR